MSTANDKAKATDAPTDGHKVSNFLRQIIETDLAQGTYAQRQWAGPLALRVSALGQIGFNDLAQKVADLVAVRGGVCRFGFVVGCAHPSILEADRRRKALEER